MTYVDNNGVRYADITEDGVREICHFKKKLKPYEALAQGRYIVGADTEDPLVIGVSFSIGYKANYRLFMLKDFERLFAEDVNFCHAEHYYHSRWVFDSLCRYYADYFKKCGIVVSQRKFLGIRTAFKGRSIGNPATAEQKMQAVIELLSYILKLYSKLIKTTN